MHNMDAASAAPGAPAATVPVSLRARGREIAWPRRPLVMGIVNINDDSFCGDGTLDAGSAMEIALRHVAAGADIIDAGAESARTNRGPVTVEEETARFLSFLPRWQAWTAAQAHTEPPVPGQVWPPLLSLNTWRPEVVERVLPHGGELLNDIGALPDDRNARLCAEHGAALLIMHSMGAPKEKHTHIGYPDIMAELERFFTEKIALATAAGLARDQIVLDPGLDFAKQQADNLTICREAAQLLGFGLPVLLPVSRKTFIGQTLHIPDPNERDAGTVASIVAGAQRGMHIFRVHNVPAAVQTLRLLDGIG